MTKDYYFAVFGSTKLNPSLDSLLLLNRVVEKNTGIRNEQNYIHKNSMLRDFESYPDKKNICDTLAHSGNNSFRMDAKNEFSPSLGISYEDIVNGHEYAWVRASCYIYATDPFISNSNFEVRFQHKKFGYYNQYLILDSSNIKVKQWNKISMDYLTPEPRRTIDSLKVHIWNNGHNTFYMDDLRIEVFEPIKK